MKNRQIHRRSFLKETSLGLFSTLIGAEIVFGNNMPPGYVPEWLTSADLLPPGKHPDLKLLNDRPWCLETPAHLLDDKITPADKLFVRNNGIYPDKPDISAWTLSLGGESVKKTKEYRLDELKKRFKSYTQQLVLECAGNGRSNFSPPAKGLNWSNGAVGCPQWTGARLRDILEDVGVKDDAVYIGYVGKDSHLSGNFEKKAISRGIPLKKAMEDETLVAWQMNGKDIPILHGYPLRLVVGGWSASVSGKWLSELLVRNKIHDGEKMKPPSYSMPCEPVAPGENAPAEKHCILEELPVKSIITYPKTGGILKRSNTLKIRGHAWTGSGDIASVEWSIDYGTTWNSCKIDPAPNRFAWAGWHSEVRFPGNGYYEIWVKARDTNNRIQPVVSPSWNEKGYYNNACHKIGIKVMQS